MRVLTGILRIAVIFDGGYFNRVSDFYKFHHDIGRRLSVGGVLDYVRGAVASMEDMDESRCPVVEAHYFRGRFTVRDLEDRAQTASYVSDALRNDRVFDQILAANNVVTHFTRIDTSQERAREKGTDVWLALESFDLAVQDRADLIALIGGDGDFVPLIRKINALGKRTMVMGWDLRAPEMEIRCAQALEREATHFLPMGELVDQPANPRQRDLADGLFVEN